MRGSPEIDEEVAHLRQHGYVVIPSVLPRVLIERMKFALAPYLRGTLLSPNDFEGFHTERVSTLRPSIPLQFIFMRRPAAPRTAG